jgi:hypothetical protein
MPPATLIGSAYPSAFRVSAAFIERAPLRQ